jgi:flagellar motility protein MotE (MotC chaperone)
MKKVMFLFVPVFLIGAVAALGLMGILKIPGLTPAKKKAVVAASSAPISATVAKPTLTPARVEPKAAVAKVALSMDVDKGAKKLGQLWNEVETPKLVELLKQWKDADAARVLGQMDASKVAELLSQMDAKRAAGLSQLIEKQASVVKPAL